VIAHRIASRSAAAAALLALSLLAGCAKRPAVAGSTEEAPRGPRRVLVIVENNARTPTMLTIWVQARRGGRQMLGTVLPDATNSFRFTPDLPSGDYVLIGRTAYGEEIVSNPFPISRTAVVSWSLFSNIATTSETVPDEP
jgi:hypothetical protein